VCGQVDVKWVFERRPFSVDSVKAMAAASATCPPGVRQNAVEGSNDEPTRQSWSPPAPGDASMGQYKAWAVAMVRNSTGQLLQVAARSVDSSGSELAEGEASLLGLRLAADKHCECCVIVSDAKTLVRCISSVVTRIG